MAQLKVKLLEAAQATKDSETKNKIEIAQGHLEYIIEQMQSADKQAERESRERIEAEKQLTERLQLAQGALIHPASVPYAMPFIPPQFRGVPPRII